MFALAYGETLSAYENRFGNAWDRLFMKTFCISDLVRNVRNKSDGFINTLLSRFSMAQAVPENMMEILSDFGLSKLKSTMRNLSRTNANEDPVFSIHDARLEKELERSVSVDKQYLEKTGMYTIAELEVEKTSYVKNYQLVKKDSLMKLSREEMAIPEKG